jgi:hypothetical protein
MERPAVLRTIRGAQPVIIPHVDARPSNGQAFVLPAPVYSQQPQRPQFADPNNMLESTRRRIKALSREGLSKRQIQLEVFGYDGGRAFYAVSEVLDSATTNGGLYTSTGCTG